MIVDSLLVDAAHRVTKTKEATLLQNSLNPVTGIPMPGDYLDLSSEPERQADGRAGTPDGQEVGAGRSAARRFVGIHFACCDVYSRVYINRQETAYMGHCPRCMKRVELKVGPGGTDARFFTAH